ncbi:MAG: two pore domain potassium channel family protein, partial [Deltaproteobacteria bacterium]|nr:two pore domain potassium channel family protein [Deltaproteobacteria bacterium]
MSNRYSWLPSATRAPHYGALLAVLLMLIVVAPLVPAERSGYAVEFFFDLVLLSGAYSAAWQSKHRFPFLALTVVTLVMRWTEVFSEHIGYSFASISITLVWITYAIMLVVAALFRMRRVSTNAIFGAIVAYLLAAVAFAFAFELIELSHPGSFAGVPVGGTESEIGNALLYFSFVCLTTMGYGDILPVSNLARPLAVLEGVFGTLYLAVMIARLVGLHIAAGVSRE